MKKIIDVATKKQVADLIIKNISVVNTFSSTIAVSDVAVSGNIIAGVSAFGGYLEDENTVIIDGTGKYLTSGLIDAHMHFESSMTTPAHYLEEICKSGTLTVINDPHEVANVCGIKGIEFIMEDVKTSPANVFFAIPSCVPACPDEENGGALFADDLKIFLSDEYKSRVVALAEMMDFNSLLAGKKTVLDKLVAYKDLPIDGHFMSDDIDDINGYYGSGVKTNHEMVDFITALKHINAGCYAAIREGTAAKNLKGILSGAVEYVRENNNPSVYSKMMFCTDDKHLEDIRLQGAIVHNIRMAVKLGVPPIEAIKMATINTAQCYNLKGHGAVISGNYADLVIFDNLTDFGVEQVIYQGGILQGSMGIKKYNSSNDIYHTIKIKEVTKRDLTLQVDDSDYIDVIGLVPDEILTTALRCRVDSENGLFVPNREFAKIACIERHNYTGHVGVGVIKGLNIQNGAVATSVGHDSHNLLVVGDNDGDILMAVNEIKDMQGGVVVVRNGKVLASISLEIAGIMSVRGNEYVIDSIKKLKQAATQIGVCEDMELLITLSFLSLPVIPQIRITTKGIIHTI